MKIFSGTANSALAQNIAQFLKTDLSPVEIHVFPDGEQRIWLQTDVVDQDTVIVQPTTTPVDANYMQLFFFVDALKRSGAKTVTVVMPYVGYQRQDHVFRLGEAVSLDVVIAALEAQGVTKVIAFDLHSIKIPELFHIPIEHMTALGLFSEIIQDNKWADKETVLVTPDMGGIRRIKILAEMLSLPYASIEKNRDLSTGNVEAAMIHGDVEKRALVVDDMISSGHTIDEAAKLLHANGVKEIHVFATHAIFSPEAPDILQKSLVENVFVTDTVFTPEEKYFDKLTIVSIAPLVAKELRS
jgi:ribose-phosphate pyrophosphokinase